MYVLQACELRKHYGEGEALVEAVRGVDVHVGSGEFVAIMGPSGSGKSTLLHLLGLVDSPSSGKILLEGRDVSLMSDDERTLVRRRRMGFIFQAFNLLSTLNAQDNVAIPLWLDRAPSAEAAQRATAMLEQVGLAHRAEHLPSALSGGEQQRVAIARALVTKPALLLADEPTGNLDSANSAQVMQLLRRLVDEQKQTIVMVTHDRQVAAAADRLLIFRDGHVESDTAAAL